MTSRRWAVSSPGYLTIAEAAGRVRCHERTIRRAIDRGALRAADLDRWLFSDENGGAP
jgi:excisionase family DNA binding protein